MHQETHMSHVLQSSAMLQPVSRVTFGVSTRLTGRPWKPCPLNSSSGPKLAGLAPRMLVVVHT
jgi:hypothetical protein